MKAPAGNLSDWITAVRPRTLPAAVSPVIVGSALAASHQSFHLPSALAALLGAVFIQIGVNLANDYFDFIKGIDTGERLGPVRVTQSGLISPAKVFAAMVISFVLASGAGILLIIHAGWPVLAIGGASIIAALAYSAGPYPLSSNGLGDPFAFFFFGPVAVCGTYYVQALGLSVASLIFSIPVGLLIAAILVVNNLRDIPTDKKVGKRTLAVIIGPTATRIEFAALISGAYLIVLAPALSGLFSYTMLLVFVSSPEALSLTLSLWRLSGKDLNLSLARTARLTLFFSILLSLGFIL